MKHKTLSFMITLLMSMVATTMTIVSCSDDNDSNDYDPCKYKPSLVTTRFVYDVSSVYAMIEGSVDFDGIEVPDSKAEVYVELSTSQDFTNAKRVEVKDINEYGFFYIYVLLEPGTTYYYRTHATVFSVSYGKYDDYGTTESFITGKTPIVVTGDVDDTSANGAKIKGNVNLSLEGYGGMTATVGIEVSENSNFSKSKKLTTNTKKGEFTIDFNQLTSGVKFYYRAYVELKTSSNQKVVYGETKTFSTYNMYVDLGLPSGTLWATMNVGASDPLSGGKNFAWGETSGKSRFNWGTYKYGIGTRDAYDPDYPDVLTKYVTNSKYGTVDNKTELELMDDAAYVNWGQDWRTPSSEQWEELLIYTKISGVRIKNPDYPDANDIFMWKIKSKINGNFIYLNPVGAPRYDVDGVSLPGYGATDILYWTRTLADDGGGQYAKAGYTGSNGSFVLNLDRCYGIPVRPVRAQ